MLLFSGGGVYGGCGPKPDCKNALVSKDSYWPLIFPTLQSNPYLMAATSPTILPTDTRTTLLQWHTTTIKKRWRRMKRKTRTPITVVTPLSTTPNNLLRWLTITMVTTQATLRTWSWGHRAWCLVGTRVTPSRRKTRRKDWGQEKKKKKKEGWTRLKCLSPTSYNTRATNQKLTWRN